MYMLFEEMGLKKKQKSKWHWAWKREGREEKSQQRRTCALARQTLPLVSSRGNDRNKKSNLKKGEKEGAVIQSNLAFEK